MGHRINKLALYEAPYNDDPAAREAFAKYLGDLSEALSEGRRGDAVALFMRYVGISSEQIHGMRNAPIWAGLEAVAPTLAYDHAGIMGQDGSIPRQRVRDVNVPTLVMYGLGRASHLWPRRPENFRNLFQVPSFSVSTGRAMTSAPTYSARPWSIS